MAACLAAVEAEEVLLQVYALEWRAIELRSKQLQNQFKQIELDEELDREERELLREHEQMLRMKEKQLVQQQYEERFRLRVAEATARKLQQQSDTQQQATAKASATVSIVNTMTETTAESKRKSKAKTVAGAGEEQKSKKASAVSKASGSDDIVKRKKKDTTKSVAFSLRKPAVSEISHVPRRLEESFNEENEPDVVNKNTTKKSAADELMMMLSQDKMSDSEGDEPSLANLISFSPAVNSTEPRYLRYGSPSRLKTNEASNDTPSKFTPSKLARSVMKKAMAIPLDFDFTRRAELAKAKAKAAKEKQQASEDDVNDDEAGVEADTPVSKKALKRRKDLGISFSSKPSALSKSTTKTTSAESEATKNNAPRGGKSLMEMVTAASLVESKLSKTKEASIQSKTNGVLPLENAKPPLRDKNQASQPKQKGKPAKEKKNDATEPESEDFIGVQAANITKRSKPKQSAKAANANSSSPLDAITEPEAEDAVAPKKADKLKDKPKKKDKLSAVEQAIAKADMLTRMSKMQDISTPKIVGKKTKKALKKTTMTTFAAKRAEFQKILADGTSEAAADPTGTDGDDIEEESAAFETPRKARTMKRKRVQDLAGQGGAAAGKTSVPSQTMQPQTGYLQSPSVAALLAMRPSKSPIGIRYVPKTPKTPQTLRKRQRPTDDDVQTPDAPDHAAQGVNAGLVTRAKKQAVRAARSAFAGTTGALTSTAGGLWGNSGPSFFDAFVNGGAPRLKRSALP